MEISNSNIYEKIAIMKAGGVVDYKEFELNWTDPSLAENPVHHMVDDNQTTQHGFDNDLSFMSFNQSILDHPNVQYNSGKAELARLIFFGATVKIIDNVYLAGERGFSGPSDAVQIKVSRRSESSIFEITNDALLVDEDGNYLVDDNGNFLTIAT